MSSAKDKKAVTPAPPAVTAPATETDDKKSETPEKFVVAVDSLCAGGVLARKPKGKMLSNAAIDALKKRKAKVQVDEKPVEVSLFDVLLKDGSIKTPADFETQLKAEAEKAKAAKEATVEGSKDATNTG